MFLEFLAALAAVVVRELAVSLSSQLDAARSTKSLELYLISEASTAT
jgi:hypothetical protein